MYEKIRLYKNYGIIVITSLLLLVFMPFFGSELGLGFVFPNTVAGWVVYVATKLIVAGANFLLLYCFVNQGKFNVRNDERYLRALAIMGELSPSEKPIPLSPAQHYRKVYGGKGITVFLTSILGSIALTQAILSFDPNTFLTYLFTLIFGLIFGVIQMEEEEVFWTDGFLAYAEYTKEEAKRRREEEAANEEVIECFMAENKELPLAGDNIG